MVSKQDGLSLFDMLLGKVKDRKFCKVFFECIPKSRTAKELMPLCEIKDLSNTKKHAKKAVEEGFLFSDTDKGVRYWYVSDDILKKVFTKDYKNIKEFRRLTQKQMTFAFDFAMKYNKNGLKKVRQNIYDDYKANMGK